MNDLKVSLVQTKIVWEDKAKNIQNLSEKIVDLTDTDLIILPEMFNTGFTMAAEKNAENMKGESVKWLIKVASSKKTHVGGSLIIEEGGNYFNRFVLVSPEGKIEYYDKRHLFRLTGEHKYFTQGKSRRIVDINSWKLNLNVCYDLRFPAWSRNNEDFDVLINVASWPNTRIDHWNALLKARAIENMCYSVGVNRVGKDENGFEYSGYSTVYHPSGKNLTEIINEENIVTVVLSRNDLEEYKNKFQFYKDRDSITIEL